MGQVVQMKKRRYDAASQSDRLSGWNAPSSDANASIDRPDIIRNRARDLARNNPWAVKGLSAIVNNTIGHGIRAQWKTTNKAKTKKLQQLWKKWAESKDCDATGMTNLYGLQQLAMRALVESGECLIRLRPRRAEDGLSVPIQLQIIEPDYLATSADGKAKNGNAIDSGIEYDSLGRRTAYYLYKHHPSTNVYRMGGDFMKYTRVPADEVIHLFRRDRAGQERGVSWLAPIIVTLRELDIYEDAYLKRQQLANLHAAFVYTEEDIDEEIEDYAETSGSISAGSFNVMRPNRTVEFNNPPQAGDYGKYTADNLGRVASALGITREALTGDLSAVNFSSARLGWQEMGRNIETWRWSLFVPQFCDTVAKWFADVTGYDNASIEWSPPARTLVDPAKETAAIKDAIRIGLMTPSEAMRAQGYDPERLMQEWSEDAKAFDKYGLVLDCDPRQDKVDIGANDVEEDENES